MIRVILVDDERHAIEAMQDVMAEFDQIEVAGTFTNPYEALRGMPALACDAVFLDIEMPGVDGMESAKKILEIDASIRIVFTTAHDQYAVEAFEVNAVDYCSNLSDTNGWPER